MTHNEPMTAEERRDMHFLVMDIRLFLRLASAHFPHEKDRLVLRKLVELAEQWGAGVDIWRERTND